MGKAVDPKQSAKTYPHDNPEQSKRFIEMAREIGAAEDEDGAERALKKVALKTPAAKNKAPGKKR